MAPKSRFKKSLNLLDVTLLGMGSVIGSGWLFGAMKATQYAGNLAWLAWVFGGIATLLIALTYAELGAALPRAGGFIRYPMYTHGSLAGWFIAFAALLAYTSTAGVETDAFRQYASGWWPALGTKDHASFIGLLVQVGLLVIFFLINYWSVNFFGKFNTAITLFKFVVPLTIIVMLLTHMHMSNFSAGGASPGGLHGVMMAVTGAGVIFAFTGFRQAIDFGAETKRPHVNIPLGVLFTLVISTLLYLGLQFAFIGAIPTDVLSQGWSHITFDQPYANIATLIGLIWLSNLVFADAVISPSATGNIYMAGTSRLIYAWAKKGAFFSWFGTVDARTGIPRGALVLTFILSVVWILPEGNRAWGVLVTASSSATVMTYMAGPVSAMSLRRTLPNMERPFHLHVAIYAIAPLAFIAATLIIYWSGWRTVLLLVGMSMGSLILYFALMDKSKEWNQKLKKDCKAGVWLAGLFLFVLGMSYIGSFGPKNSSAIIHKPWDTLIVGICSLFFYFWGLASAFHEPQIDSDEEELP